MFIIGKASNEILMFIIWTYFIPKIKAIGSISPTGIELIVLSYSWYFICNNNILISKSSLQILNATLVLMMFFTLYFLLSLFFSLTLSHRPKSIFRIIDDYPGRSLKHVCLAISIILLINMDSFLLIIYWYWFSFIHPTILVVLDGSPSTLVVFSYRCFN